MSGVGYKPKFAAPRQFVCSTSVNRLWPSAYALGIAPKPERYGDIADGPFPAGRRKHGLVRHCDGFAKRLAAQICNAYPGCMCRHITKEQQIEGWRALIELLPKLRPRVLGIMPGALMARLHRGIYAAVGRRTAATRRP